MKVRVHKTSLTSPHFIEVPVPSPENEWSCISAKVILYQARKISGHVLVLRLLNLPISTIFLLDVGNVPAVWCFLFLILLFTKVTFSFKRPSSP